MYVCVSVSVSVYNLNMNMNMNLDGEVDGVIFKLINGVIGIRFESSFVSADDC